MLKSRNVFHVSRTFSLKHKALKRLSLGIGLVVFFFLPSSVHAFSYPDRISISKGLAHYAMGHMYDLLGLTNQAVLEYEKSLQFDDSNYLSHLRLGADYARLDLLLDAEKELKLVHQFNAEDLQSHYLLALIYSTQKEYDKAAAEYEHILKKFSNAEPENIEIYGYLGQLYYSQKKYDQAIGQFEKILAIEPNNADVLYLLGSLYVEIGNKERAIELLEQSLKINPEHDGSLNTLGYLYAESDTQLDKAEELVKRALVVNPDNGAYLDSLGWIYYKKENYEKALELFMQADKILKDPVIYEHIGDVYNKMNKFEEAIKYWQMSLDLQPDQEQVKQKVNEAKNIQASK